MINVVFLLLIFFMMTARITQPAPFEVTLPDAGLEGELAEDATLYIASGGLLDFNGVTGDAVWDVLAQADLEGPLTVRADAALRAQSLAALLQKLSEVGIVAVELAVAQP